MVAGFTVGVAYAVIDDWAWMAPKSIKVVIALVAGLAWPVTLPFIAGLWAWEQLRG